MVEAPAWLHIVCTHVVEGVVEDTRIMVMVMPIGRMPISKTRTFPKVFDMSHW